MLSEYIDSAKIENYDGLKKISSKINDEITINHIIVSNTQNTRLEIGEYYMIDFKNDILDYQDKNEIVEIVKKVFGKLITQKGKILAVGLGNRNVVSDSFGIKTVQNLVVFSESEGKNMKSYLNAIIPNVLGVTGIESFDIIQSICKQIKPNLVLLIDTLCANTFEKLTKSIQICNSYIVPGSGVKDKNKKLSKETLGCSVIIIGVPMLINIRNILNELNIEDKKCDIIGDVWVSSKEIDFVVKDYAKIISRAINEFFYTDFTKEELSEMI